MRTTMRTMAIAFCFLSVACARDVAAQEKSGSTKAVEGLWSGAWGGGDRDGVVFQPVLAELLIQGDFVELYGFRNLNRLTGTIRVDSAARKMRITPADTGPGREAAKAIEYTYQLKGDQLTLIDADAVPISLQRHAVAQNPRADVRLEFVAATGMNDAGDLLVTEYTMLKAAPKGAAYSQPVNRSLKTRQAAVFLVQETGLKKIAMAEARGLIRNTTLVAVSYRQDDQPLPPQFHELWKDMGPLPPDSDAVQQTFTRMLRPGTLVFVLSARENLPVP